jgi:hypothetical protein
MEDAGLGDMIRYLTWRTLLLIPFFVFPGLLIYYLGYRDPVLVMIYGILAVLSFFYPVIRYSINPTFFYWKLYIQKIYSKFVLVVKYSVLSLFTSTLFVTGVFWYLTQPSNQEWLIVITAFYASILLFREVFSDFSILRLGIMHQIYGVHQENLSIETRIGNIGTKTVTDPHLEYRVYDNRGIPLGESKEVDIPGKNRSLDPGEWTEEESISIIIDLTKFQEKSYEFYLHTIAYSGFGDSLLADNRIRKCVKNEGSFVEIED